MRALGNMKIRLSKFIFILEIILLIWPTILGLMLIGGSILPFLTGAFTSEYFIKAITGLFIATSLFSGSFLAFKFFLSELHDTKQIIWVICTISAITSAISLALVVLVKDNNGYNIFTALMLFGVLYIIPLIHLYLERCLRNEQP